MVVAIREESKAPYLDSDLFVPTLEQDGVVISKDSYGVFIVNYFAAVVAELADSNQILL